MPLARDQNYKDAHTRQGPPIMVKTRIRQDVIGTSAGTTPTPWIRICPSGNTAEKVTGNKKQLDLQMQAAMSIVGFDPEFVAGGSLDGWKLRILNPGFPQVHRIVSNNGGTVVTLHEELDDRIPDDGIEWVVYPEALFPITIQASGVIAFDMEVGYIKDDIYTLTPTDAMTIYGDLQRMPDEILAIDIRTDRLDRIAVRFPRNDAAIAGDTGETIRWGEFTVTPLA